MPPLLGLPLQLCQKKAFRKSWLHCKRGMLLLCKSRRCWMRASALSAAASCHFRSFLSHMTVQRSSTCQGLFPPRHSSAERSGLTSAHAPQSFLEQPASTQRCGRHRCARHAVLHLGAGNSAHATNWRQPVFDCFALVFPTHASAMRARCGSIQVSCLALLASCFNMQQAAYGPVARAPAPTKA